MLRLLHLFGKLLLEKDLFLFHGLTNILSTEKITHNKRIGESDIPFQ